MIEIPEARTLSRQINEYLAGKTIASVLPKSSPHKFAWYFGDPDEYERQMKGLTLGEAYPVAGFVEIRAGDMRILFTEGVNLTYLESEKQIPKKHQFLVGFTDGTYLCSTIQMYGGMGCFKAGENDNPYYLMAREKPAPHSEGFTFDYFQRITSDESLQKKSAKAVLATEQRIPGLGNGVLQDILYYGGIHPKRKLNTIDDDEFRGLYDSILTTLAAMTEKGGRDTEKDLRGNPGAYVTRCSKNTVGTACGKCGELIVKQSYMGGSVYFCPGCQPL